MVSKILLSTLPVMAGFVLVLSVGSIAEKYFEAKPSPSSPVLLSLNRPGSGCNYADQIGAIGFVEPAGGVVDVRSQANGIVREVLVSPGSFVRKGQPLVRLDRRSALAALGLRQSEHLLAQAKLAAVRATTRELRADVNAAYAAVEAQKTVLIEAQDLAERGKRLKTSSTLSNREQKRRQYSVARAAAIVRQAQARLAKAQSRFDLIDRERDGSDISVQLAEVTRARALVKSAEIDVDILTVKAPSDGTILAVNVQPGELAERVSEPLVLMGDRANLQVRVDIDEADISRFQAGLPARAFRRGSSASALELTPIRVEQIIAPKNRFRDRVGERFDSRVLQAIYRVDDNRLIPGELVDAFIGENCMTSNNVPVKTVGIKN